MKSRIPSVSTCTKCQEQLYQEWAYDIFDGCVDSVASNILCMSIYVLEMEHKSEEEILKFIEDFKFISGLKNIFDKQLRTEDVMKIYSERYGINFDDIKLNNESKSHFMTRTRKDNE